MYLFEELVGVNARDIKFSKKGPSPSRAIPHQLLLWTVPLRQTTVANCVRPWSPGTSHGFSGFLYLPSVWKGYGSPEGCGTGACFAHWARQAPVCLRFLLIGASRMGYVRAAALKPAWGFHPQPPSSFRSALRNFIPFCSSNVKSSPRACHLLTWHTNKMYNSCKMIFSGRATCRKGYLRRRKP